MSIYFSCYRQELESREEADRQSDDGTNKQQETGGDEHRSEGEGDEEEDEEDQQQDHESVNNEFDLYQAF